MGFFLQLKLLLWKNIMLRRRQKIRCVVELVWPLFLFLILMWVRTRELKLYKHECHFRERAMPSAGHLPFLHSVFCGFNNTCHRTEQEAEGKGSSLFNLKSIPNFMSDIEELINNKFVVEKQQKNNLLDKDIEDIIILAKKLLFEDKKVEGNIPLQNALVNPQKLKKSMESRNVSLSVESLNTLLNSQIDLTGINLRYLPLLQSDPKAYLCDPTMVLSIIKNKNDAGLTKAFEEICQQSETFHLSLIESVIENLDIAEIGMEAINVLENNLGRSLSWIEWMQLRNVTADMLYEAVHMDSYEAIYRFINDAMRNYNQVMDVSERYNISKLYVNFLAIQNLLCGLSVDNIISILNDNQQKVNKLESLREKFHKGNGMNDAIESYVPDIDAGIECNEMMRQLWENPVTYLMARQIKPFFRGKILFSPSSPSIEQLMSKVNKTFQLVSERREIWDQNGRSILNILENELLNNSVSLQVAKNFFASQLGVSIVENIGNSEIFKSLSQSDNSSVQYLHQLISRFFDENNSTLRKNVVDSLNGVYNIISLLFQCFDVDRVESFESEEKATTVGMDLLKQQKLWAVIVFKEIDSNNELPSFVKYKIRMDAALIDDTAQINDRIELPGPRRDPIFGIKYISSGFAYLQDIIEHSIIEEHTGISDIPGIILQQFPYPCYIVDRFVLAISRQMPMFMTLSWVYSCAMITKSIVYEKEYRLKETMRVMGLGNGIHWLGWFIDSIVPMSFTVVMLTCILVYGKVLENSDPTLVFTFLLINCIATISQSFLISTFFSRANLAAAAGGIIFFILYLPYPSMVIWERSIPTIAKIFTSLLSNVAFGFGCSYLALHEQSGVGMHWDNLRTSPITGDRYNLLYVMYMLAFDSVLYLLLAWYFEALFPGLYGIPKPWYFPCLKSFFCGSEKIANIVENMSNQNDGERNFEAEPTYLKAGVTVHNLSKVYKTGKFCLNNLSLNFYEDQITCFLGHNGAGKTTTISILTGLFPPTSGTAKIYGLDIWTQMDEIRQSLGMCPQHNILFDKLSVEDHLWFYARLKGHPKEKTFLEINDMLVDLGLLDKRHSLACHLSGGMKRKLSIASAFIGGSRTVILDEPTAGVDPFSRRSIWEVLLKYKKGRTVILTTHFMDEADLLGDRIAMISNGKLKCCGSSLFLRTRFGKGYYLTIETHESDGSNGNEHNINSENDQNNVIKDIHELILSQISSAELQQHVGSELLYLLPKNNNSKLTEKLLQLLEEKKNELHIVSYGITDTSLEEIFLQVCGGDPTFSEGDLFVDRHKPMVNIYMPIPAVDIREGGSIKTIFSESKSLKFKQFLALQLKHLQHTKRNPKGLICEIILPAFFVFLALLFSLILPQVGERPELILQPWAYGDNNYVFYSIDNLSSYTAHQLEREMLGKIGFGTKCVIKNGIRDTSCNLKETTNIYYQSPVNLSNEYSHCSCKVGSLVCAKEINEKGPPSAKVSTGDNMLNLTNQNISDWLVKSNNKYFKNRYGGFSFGIPNTLQYFNETQFINIFIQYFEFTGINRAASALREIYKKCCSKENNTKSLENVKVWFNNKGWISSVSYMNSINNLILRTFIKGNNTARKDYYGIEVINHPMNLTRAQVDEELTIQSAVSLIHAVSVIFALSFVPASFLIFLVEERISKFKHLQFVSGVDFYIYWIAAFFWDLMNFAVSAMLCVFVFIAFNEEAYIANIPALILLLFLYGWAVIPLMYPASFIFSVSSTAFVTLACINLFIGVITTIATFMLEIMDDEELKYIGSITSKVFLIFPQFCLGQGLMNMASLHVSSRLLSQFGITIQYDIYEWNNLGRNLFFMVIEGLIFFLITLILERKAFELIGKSNNVPHEMKSDKEDDDILNEKMRITKGDAEHDVLVLNKLSKIYGGNHVAVNNISVGVRRGECFGLLGLNGAGKTSTFKMLTGDVVPSSGDALVCGFSIVKQMKKVQKHIGYCPQFDALDPLLTPREHLEFFTRLRGLDSSVQVKYVDDLLNRLQLNFYQDRHSQNLSGGNRRKLSTAIALVGEPDLIFLDEPTTGMDPKSKRFLWSCILDFVRQGHSVVLTSHSMEECESLCTKLTIMANGHFKCLGSPQHLKFKYGQGYIIIVKAASNMLESAIEKIKSLLPQALLTETHFNQAKFQVLNNVVHLSVVFNCMEECREIGLVLDYSVSQTTLEEVFLQFANAEYNKESVYV